MPFSSLNKAQTPSRRQTIAAIEEFAGIQTLAFDGVAACADRRRVPPAASTAPASDAKTPAADSADNKLTAEQARLADRYKELERVILRMAEVMKASDPKRAALLQQAFAQSKERQIDLQFEDVVKLLEKEQLYQANKGQVAVQQDLNRLLQLLLSGEREKQIASERVELKKFIERINKLIRQQQGIQGETDGQGDVPDLTKRQTDVADKTGELATDLKKFAGRNEPAGAGDQQGDKTGDKPGDKKSDAKRGDKKTDTKPDEKKAGGDKSDKPDDKKSDDKSSDKSDAKPGDKSGASEKANQQIRTKPDQGEKSDKQNDKSNPSDDKQDGQPGTPGDSQNDKSPTASKTSRGKTMKCKVASESARPRIGCATPAKSWTMPIAMAPPTNRKKRLPH